MAIGLTETFQHSTGNWEWGIPEGFEHVRNTSNQIKIAGRTGHTGTHPLRAEGYIKGIANNVIVKVVLDSYTTSKNAGAAATVNVRRNGQMIKQLRTTAFVTKLGSESGHEEESIGVGGGNLEIDFSMESGDRGAINQVSITISESGSAPTPIPVPTPTPTPIKNHNITMAFSVDVSKYRTLIASRQLDIKNLVEKKLGKNFELSGVNVAGNHVELLITEFGNNLIPGIIVAAIVGIVLLILAVAGAFFVGWTYRENDILKATNAAQGAALDNIQSIINDPNLTDEQKVDLIGNELSKVPDVVIPPGDGGFDFPDFGLGAGAGAIVVIAILAIAMSKK